MRQIIFEGREIKRREGVVILQGLYADDGRLVLEMRMFKDGKETGVGARDISPQKAYAVARAYYLEQTILYSELGLLRRKAYRNKLNLIHARTQHIDAIERG